MASLVDEEDFPLVCGDCLGQNTFIRMMKDPNGGPCKVCNRPFTGFHWRPGGKNTRPKKTETCSTCARAKDLCQTCQLDLKFHLPAKVRDQALAPADRQLVAPARSDATREYTANQTARDVASGAIDAVYNAPPINDIAHRLQRKQPNYRRNRPKVCTFFLENRCKKGKYCPFLHELPDPNQDPSLGKQSLVDRYHGTNDPVADRMLSRKRRWEAPKPLSPPPPPPRPWIEDRHGYGQSPPRPVQDRPGTPRAGGSSSAGERADGGRGTDVMDRLGPRGSGVRERPGTPRSGYTERPGTPRGGYDERPSTPRGGYTERPGTPRAGSSMDRPSTPRGEPDRPGTPRAKQEDRRVGWGPRTDAHAAGVPVPPSDPEIKELYIGGLGLRKHIISAEDVESLFSDCTGLSTVLMKLGFAFAIFRTRAEAEQAMVKHHGEQVVRGSTVNVKWGNKSKKEVHERPFKRPRI